jgi:hypothetical protein
MYTITVTALGFKKLVSTDVKLTVGQNYNLVDRATDKFCQNRCIRGVVGGTACRAKREPLAASSPVWRAGPPEVM